MFMWFTLKQCLDLGLDPHSFLKSGQSQNHKHLLIFFYPPKEKGIYVGRSDFHSRFGFLEEICIYLISMPVK